MLELSVLRHGQTQLLTQGHVLRGRLDDPLTDQGWQQMRLAFDDAWRQTPWQAIISSSLSRCADFGRAMSEAYDLPFYVLDGLMELDFGDWEGCLTADLYEKYPEQLSLWWQTPTQFTPPGGESVMDFAYRITQALSYIEHLSDQCNYQRVCVISHGGVIKCLHCMAKNLSLDELLKQPASLGEFYHFGLNQGDLFL